MWIGSAHSMEPPAVFMMLEAMARAADNRRQMARLRAQAELMRRSQMALDGRTRNAFEWRLAQGREDPRPQRYVPAVSADTDASAALHSSARKKAQSRK